MNPIGPRAMVWVTPFNRLWISTGPPSVCTAPWPTKMMPNTKAMGKKM